MNVKDKVIIKEYSKDNMDAVIELALFKRLKGERILPKIVGIKRENDTIKVAFVVGERTSRLEDGIKLLWPFYLKHKQGNCTLGDTIIKYNRIIDINKAIKEYPVLAFVQDKFNLYQSNNLTLVNGYLRVDNIYERCIFGWQDNHYNSPLFDLITGYLLNDNVKTEDFIRSIHFVKDEWDSSGFEGTFKEELCYCLCKPVTIWLFYNLALNRLGSKSVEKFCKLYFKCSN